MHSAKRQIHYGRDIRSVPEQWFWSLCAVLAGLIFGWPLQPAAKAEGKGGKEAAEAQPIA